MTMMLTVYCPECYKTGRYRENSLLACVSDLCTDAGFDLEGRNPTPEEKKEVWDEDERHIQEIEDNEQKCGLCGLVFRIKRTDPSFGCPKDHMPGTKSERSFSDSSIRPGFWKRLYWMWKGW